MRVLILVDNLDNWSIHNRAKAIAKHIPGIEFVIRSYVETAPIPKGTDDKATHFAWRAYKQNRLLYCVRDADLFDVVHFNFTGHVTKLYDWIMEHRHKVLLTIANERGLFDGVAVDHPKFLSLVKCCPYITAVSPKVAQAISHSVYTPNGIDPELFSLTKPVVVGYAGTSKPNKNTKVIEQACKELKVKLKATYYAGDHGNQPYPHNKMQEFYCGLTVYVHASLTEGFNNTIIEALSCNIPVLMTRQGAWKEFVGYVEFIEPTVEDIKAKLLKWCGRQLIQRSFLWSNVIPKYREMYERIKSQSGARSLPQGTLVIPEPIEN